VAHPLKGNADDLRDASRGERLQRVLADSGVGSRRACETMIKEGKVTVNGRVITDLPCWVDPSADRIEVRGRPIRPVADHVYVMLNKPARTLSAASDEPGADRTTVVDLVRHPSGARLFPIDRLDYDTTGLILLTNDGDLAQRLAHPSWEVPKTYLASVNGRVPRGLVKRLKEGVELEDGIARADAVTIKEAAPMASIIEITLHDGRNRVVRRMLEAVGHPVIELVRTQVGPIRLGDLRSGRSRIITGAELRSLMSSVGM